jgi:hypothetical protein
LFVRSNSEIIMKRNAYLKIIGCLSLAVLPLSAQDEARQKEIISAVGEQAGNALITTHQAVNLLANRWGKKSIKAEEALELATSYRGSAELCAKLVAGKSAPVEQAAAALVKQATTLEAWIKVGDAAMGGIHAKLKAEADALMAGNAAAAPAAGIEGTIELKTVKSTGPNGKPGPLGVMNVVRRSAELPVEVSWSYPGGGTDKGLCVPFPGTGKMAVFFGAGVKTVAIYERNGTTATGRWVANQPGSKISGIKLEQGASKTEYNIEGGGQMVLDMQAGMTANVTWKFDKGEMKGIAVGDNKYLALISMAPDAKAGVALYTMNADGKSATGRWTMAGAKGAGEDELVVVKATGMFAGGAPAGDAPADGGEKDQVVEIAKKLGADLGNAAPLKPTAAQIAAISATPEAAEKLAVYVEAVYKELTPGKPAAKASQTVIKVVGPDLKELAGGYGKEIANFKPGLRIYGVKYLEPGAELGMSFDGLMPVDGKWIFIPKAWRAFR